MTEAIIEVTENGKVSLKSRLARTTPERVDVRREILVGDGEFCDVKLPEVRGFSTYIKLSHSCVTDVVEVAFLDRSFSPKRYSVGSGESMVFRLDGDPRGTEMMLRHGDLEQGSVPEEVRI